MGFTSDRSFISSSQYRLGRMSECMDMIWPILIKVGPRSSSIIRSFSGVSPFVISYLCRTAVISRSLLLYSMDSSLLMDSFFLCLCRLFCSALLDEDTRSRVASICSGLIRSRSSSSSSGVEAFTDTLTLSFTVCRILCFSSSLRALPCSTVSSPFFTISSSISLDFSVVTATAPMPASRIFLIPSPKFSISISPFKVILPPVTLLSS